MKKRWSHLGFRCIPLWHKRQNGLLAGNESPGKDAQALIQLENCTEVMVRIRQFGCEEVKYLESQSTEHLTWQPVSMQSLRLLQLSVASNVGRDEDTLEMETLLADRRASNAAASTSAGLLHSSADHATSEQAFLQKLL